MGKTILLSDLLRLMHTYTALYVRMMNEILLYVIISVLITMVLLGCVGIVLENEYLCVTCFVLAYITMLCSIIILGVYYVQ